MSGEKPLLCSICFQPVALKDCEIDEDGRAVMQPGATDGLPVQVNGHFEARRQPGMTPGTDINVPMSFNIVLHLTPGRRYSWVLDVDGQADDSWQLSFETRQAG